MSNLINTDPIAGGSVYGVRQTQYTVDGESGKDFTAAVTLAAFRQSAAIEAAASGYVEVVRARQKKVSDLGDVLAYISKAIGQLKSKGGNSEDRVTMDNADWVNRTARSYGIVLVFDAYTANMSRTNIMKGQTEVQYQLEKEDNNLQQDLVTMQSFLTKRDNAYSTAAKVVKKTLEAASSTIGNIGT